MAKPMNTDTRIALADVRAMMDQGCSPDEIRVQLGVEPAPLTRQYAEEWDTVERAWFRKGSKR